jgi:hypothetical protein
MGLDISAGGFGFRAGSYTGFSDFRNWLIKQLGYNDPEKYFMEYENKAGKFGQRTGMYTKAGSIPCGALMFHSDCDGQIGPKHAEKLLKDLKKIKDGLPDIKTIDKMGLDDEEYFRSQLNNWIEACEEVIELQEPIYFG